MKSKERIRNEDGSLSGNLLLWLLGVPLPIILLISLLRGCQ